MYRASEFFSVLQCIEKFSNTCFCEFRHAERTAGSTTFSIFRALRLLWALVATPCTRPSVPESASGVSCQLGREGVPALRVDEGAVVLGEVTVRVRSGGLRHLARSPVEAPMGGLFCIMLRTIATA